MLHLALNLITNMLSKTWGLLVSLAKGCSSTPPTLESSTPQLSGFDLSCYTTEDIGRELLRRGSTIRFVLIWEELENGRVASVTGSDAEARGLVSIYMEDEGDEELL